MSKTNSWLTPAREYAKGIGDAVADRTINRKLDPLTRKELEPWAGVGPEAREFTRETWEEVALRVAAGNTSLREADGQAEFHRMHHHLRQASVLMSGRHLQHTDPQISQRNMEVLTNCSTAASTFLLFYLLLNGSGVGRSYDDDMVVADWTKQPKVQLAIRADHPDVLSGEIQDIPAPDNLYLLLGTRNLTTVYRVPDSREGWAKAIEQIERMAFEGKTDEVLVLDFSDVRCKGSPIGGMQNRPASGPAPLMKAIQTAAKLRGADMEPWEAAMHADHAFAECVLVGGARRAARMATKSWRDKSVAKFVNIKKGGVLWSSNNSVTVDEDFWRGVKTPTSEMEFWSSEERDLAMHAKEVFDAIAGASYHDGTGEPGLINVDKLTQKDKGVEALFDGDYAHSERFRLDEGTKAMTAAIAKAFAGKPLNMITNPCGEIPLSMVGGYCVIADVVPFHTKDDDDAEDAFRTATRALMRVNTMNCLYGKEVARTNRIGVGFTGIFEYAWSRFGFGWKDLVDEQKSLAFWKMMARFSNAVVHESIVYAGKLGVAVPHTSTTVKPAGTTSKLFGLTEGGHLPSMREFVRWVQFRNDDPLVEQYRAAGYPVKVLTTYSGTTVVGFPTVPLICTLGMGDALVTAAEATPEEQYEWLRLLEKYWLGGHDEASFPREPGHSYGGQVSYTLKYDPKVVDYATFRRTLIEGQSSVKCCSVMPQTDTTAYEYQPEEPVSTETFNAILAAINDPALKQDIGREHLDCSTGACPVDFNAEAA